MATDLIRYDLLVQEALRSVVRKVLSDAARDGLQGEHHFYITFKTHAPGVRLSERMRNQYPTEMTIILQHQFWGLNVLDRGFEVGLSFQKIPETLFIPFEALTGFVDPSVQFGLKFESEIGANDVEGPIDTAVEAVGLPKAVQPSQETDASQTAAEMNSDGKHPAEAAKAAISAARTAVSNEDTKVISIDAFRKKP